VIREVRFSVAARKDIDKYADYIGADSPDAARRFIDEAEATQEELRRFPFVGAELKLKRLGLPGVRRWRISGFPRHLFVYVVRDGRVDVLCVTHGARDLPKVLRILLHDPEAHEF
jgi:toxin ParE1/3/4